MPAGLGMNCSVQLRKKIIQIYLKTLLISKITWGGFFLKQPVYLSISKMLHILTMFIFNLALNAVR